MHLRAWTARKPRRSGHEHNSPPGRGKRCKASLSPVSRFSCNRTKSSAGWAIGFANCGRRTQDEFADKAGFHRAQIGAFERGEMNITLASLHLIADALGVRIVELFKGGED